jgi:hypothetical protein
VRHRAGLRKGVQPDGNHDETAATALAFWARARTYFAGHGITVERVLTGNGSAYRSHAWRAEHHPRHDVTAIGASARSSGSLAPGPFGSGCPWGRLAPPASSRAALVR